MTLNYTVSEVTMLYHHTKFEVNLKLGFVQCYNGLMTFSILYANQLINIHKYANIATGNYTAPEIITLYHYTNFEVDAHYGLEDTVDLS